MRIRLRDVADGSAVRHEFQQKICAESRSFDAGLAVRNSGGGHDMRKREGRSFRFRRSSLLDLKFKNTLYPLLQQHVDEIRFELNAPEHVFKIEGSSTGQKASIKINHSLQ